MAEAPKVCATCRKGHYAVGWPPGHAKTGEVLNFPCPEPDTCECWFCGPIKTPAQAAAWGAYKEAGGEAVPPEAAEA